ncbi:DNA topoisomerase III [Oleiharenicola sp. Vm1]|uniref:DNA topoisomerase III n=1 Tax=Oleiharenicola sp. Vm1 TaxID=3398393 RepID=UPI0039F5EED3
MPTPSDGRLFITEKPNQAADLAKVLGSERKTSTHWETADGRVTWLFGHMLRLAQPEEYDPKWGGRWSWEQLPILPERPKFLPIEKTMGRLREVGALLRECSEVVVATDGDPEGEMIGREVLAHFNWRGPTRRLWLTALDPANIRKALDRIKPGEETVRLYYAAAARSEADWLVGMGPTRAATLKSPRAAGTMSVGRVQTPTLALVVRRDREIENFKPSDYFEVIAQLRTDAGVEIALRHAPGEEHRITKRADAERIVAGAQGARGPLSVETETGKREKSPSPFSLAALQKKADALWGWPAKKTLQIAQELYEEHKCTSYPRTDVGYLPEEQMADVPKITAALVEYPEFAALRSATFKAGHWFNDKKIGGSHHGIIPTNFPDLAKLNESARDLYLLIARQYLASLMPDYVFDAVNITFTAGVEFRARGTVPVDYGWRAAFRDEKPETGEEEEADVTLPKVKDGEPAAIMKTSVDAKRTRPPRRYTEGTLLADMENVAKFVTDPQLRAILNRDEGKQRGIGTSATRAEILATLVDRDYIGKKGRQITSTPKGRALVALLERAAPPLVDAGETAIWQMSLDAIAEGGDPAEFVRGIKGRVTEYIASLHAADAAQLASAMGIGPTQGTGVMIPAAPGAQDAADVELVDEGEYFTAAGWVGRFYKNVAGAKLTAAEMAEVVRAGAAGVEREVPSLFKGRPPQKVKLTFDANAKPYPKINVQWPQKAGTSSEGAPTGVEATWGKHTGEILDWGTFYTVPGVQSNERDTKFMKALAGHQLTPQELAAILGGGKEGTRMSGQLFRSGAGAAFKSDPIVFYNARKKPYPGLEFNFG